MFVAPPAKMVVIGAGPVGIETALYARFLGYEVDLVERGRVADAMRRWGHVRLFTPVGMNCSRLGLAALRAQDDRYTLPPDDQLLTGRELVDLYYQPLAQSDLLIDGLQEGTEVVAIGREGLLKGDRIGQASRAECPFRLLLRREDGTESVRSADVVIDCSGTYGHPNALGQGGIPAPGEIEAARAITTDLPDLVGEERGRFAGRHTLLVGDGYSAATTLVGLAELADQAAGTRVTWLTRGTRQPPIRRIQDDPLPQRDRLAQNANQLAREHAAIEHLAETTVGAIRRVAGSAGPSPPGAAGGSGGVASSGPVEPRFEVELVGRHAGRRPVDRIVAHVGNRPDWTFARELQLEICYATEGPLRLAAHLLGQSAADCLQTTAGGAETLAQKEPNFYILGAKSYGRRSDFLLRTGLTQIRDLFALIMDSPDLDLYKSIRP